MTEPVDLIWFDAAPEGPWQPGWAFPDPYSSRAPGAWLGLSKQYLDRDAPNRPPIAVVLPTRDGHATWFGIDGHPTDQPEGHWEVTIVGPLIAGQKPDITVTPSINAVGLYHGFLTHGTLTADGG